MAGFATGSPKISPYSVVIVDVWDKRPNSTFGSSPPTNARKSNSLQLNLITSINPPFIRVTLKTIIARIALKVKSNFCDVQDKPNTS
jgi:hypothetical protein